RTRSSAFSYASSGPPVSVGGAASPEAVVVRNAVRLDRQQERRECAGHSCATPDRVVPAVRLVVDEGDGFVVARPVGGEVVLVPVGAERGARALAGKPLPWAGVDSGGSHGCDHESSDDHGDCRSGKSHRLVLLPRAVRESE